MLGWGCRAPNSNAATTNLQCIVVEEDDLAAKLPQDHFTSTAALIALMLKNLPDDVRMGVLDAVRNVELRTPWSRTKRELVLVPTDGSAPLLLAKTQT